MLVRNGMCLRGGAEGQDVGGGADNSLSFTR